MSRAAALLLRLAEKQQAATNTLLHIQVRQARHLARPPPTPAQVAATDAAAVSAATALLAPTCTAAAGAVGNRTVPTRVRCRDIPNIRGIHASG
jgi:hypothetical protein